MQHVYGCFDVSIRFYMDEVCGLSAESLVEIKNLYPANNSSYFSLLSPFGFSETELNAYVEGGYSNQFSYKKEKKIQLLFCISSINLSHSVAQLQLLSFDRFDGISTIKHKLDQLKESLSVSRLYSMVYKHESNEIKILEMLGFEKEVEMREQIYLNGSYQDILIFGEQRPA